MINFFKNLLNLQVFISYIGISPFIFILFDINFFNIFSINLLKDFIFLYVLIIITFIGAIRWNFVVKSNIYSTLFGFLPSLIATFFIILYLSNLNINFIFSLVLLFLIIQLLGDFIFYRYNNFEKNFFLVVRLPVTLIIIVIMIYVISV